MDTRKPDRLVLGYTRTLMDFLRFHPSPRHIGMIGLGGGSLVKHCYRSLPEARISVAEISAEVIAFRDRFLIPADDSRFGVFCEDGADFVKRNPGGFDVLIVDGFDSAGQPPQLSSAEFYDDCYRALTSDGVMAANVCEGRTSVLIDRLRRSFRKRILVVGGEESDNAIVFAAKGKIAGTRPSPAREAK